MKLSGFLQKVGFSCLISGNQLGLGGLCKKYPPTLANEVRLFNGGLGPEREEVQHLGALFGSARQEEGEGGKRAEEISSS